jgi:hypothetical protein
MQHAKNKLSLTFGYNQWRDFKARHCPTTPNII